MSFDPATGLYNDEARWYSTAVSTFISRDPMAADINLYRYCGNNPVILVDPTGLWDLVKDVKTCTITLEMSWYMKWEGTWTAAQKATWENAINGIINRSFGSRTIAARALRSGALYCGCCPTSKLEVNVKFYDHWWNFGCDYVVTVHSGDIRSYVSSSTGYAEFSQSDITSSTYTHSVTGAAYTQPTIAHEFGHMIALNHPGYGLPGVVPNSRPEYEADAAALMGLGNQMRDAYWEPILQRLREQTGTFCEWTLGK
jgi:hypothetical protein